MYREYWRLWGLYKFNLIYKETNGNIWPLLKLYKELIKKRGMRKEEVINAADIAFHKLLHMESLYRQAKDQVNKMQLTRQHLLDHKRLGKIKYQY
jgi:hypothetical protein